LLVIKYRDLMKKEKQKLNLNYSFPVLIVLMEKFIKKKKLFKDLNLSEQNGNTKKLLKVEVN
jgi:hypothetical protein